MYICIHTPRHMKDDARKQQKLIYRLEKGYRSTRKGINTENKLRECWLIRNKCKGTWANSLWRSLASSFPLKAQEVIMVPVSFCNISRLHKAICYTLIQWFSTFFSTGPHYGPRPHACHLHITSSIQTNQIYSIIYSLNVMISKRLHLLK